MATSDEIKIESEWRSSGGDARALWRMPVVEEYSLANLTQGKSISHASETPHSIGAS